MSNNDSNLTQELVKTLVHYDPETGKFTRIATKRTDRIGAVIGYLAGRGHIQIGINGKAYYAHRVAWLFVYGKWPEGQVDHINGIRHDNRICNLRDVSGSINQQNRHAAQSSSSSGLMGVLKSSARPKRPWKSEIKIDGKSIGLGSYKTAEEAHSAYMQAKLKYHPGFVPLPEQQ